MTQNEILEGNKLIAEFMGWKYCDNDLVFNSHVDNSLPHNSVFSGWVKREYPYTKGVPIIVVKSNKLQVEHLRKLLYHSSWDWLMPVVEKIYEWSNINTDKYHKYFWDEQNNKEDFLIFNVYPIENLYPLVVEFIKWYNQNK